jgi:hypothetical protein
MTDDYGPKYSDYYWIKVRKLPVPHNPFRLPPELLTDWQTGGSLLPGRVRPVHNRLGRRRWAAQQRRRANLAEIWDIAAIDWGFAVELARRIWDGGEDKWSTHYWADEVLDGQPDDIAIAADSLCFLPIAWSRGDEGFTNGQHRSLILEVQQVESVLVCGTH